MLKYIFFSIILYISTANCAAQETVEKRHRLTDSVVERFFVLKSDPEIKQGLYKAFYQRKTLVAIGNYDHGKKTGNWNFYDTMGGLAERYDYDTNTFKFEAPLYAGTYLSFVVDEKVTNADTFRRPVKIGGTYFGFIPYVSLFHLPFDTFDINTDTFEAYVELLISPGGRLADYKVHLASSYYQYSHTVNMDINLFSEADRTFVAGTLNGNPVLSRIFIRCWVTPNGELDFY
jgi:hypothetical protein